MELFRGVLSGAVAMLALLHRDLPGLYLGHVCLSVLRVQKKGAVCTRNIEKRVTILEY